MGRETVFHGQPLACHITFTCYGTRLHGDELGSVTRWQNVHGTPFVAHNPGLQGFERAELVQLPYLLDEERRRIVLASIVEFCKLEGWRLLAAHVLERHVHVVLEAQARPEKVMTDMKSYASRMLNQAGVDLPERKRWTRHGSTRYKWTTKDVEEAVDYVVRGQDVRLETYEYDGD